MKLSAIAEKVASKATDKTAFPEFVVKSKETGNLLKVIAKSPKGNFLVTKMSGKNVGKEILVEDSERYVLANDGRIKEIKELLSKYGTEAEALESKMAVLEDELEALEEAAS